MSCRFSVPKTSVAFWVALALASIRVSAAPAQAQKAFSLKDFNPNS
jgi:hypothetical protein